jgi:hypothetical protein
MLGTEAAGSVSLLNVDMLDKPFKIIQLFGRGVRLKGCGMSLKRSGFFKKDYPETQIPKYIGILETLNLFGVHADYMKQFKAFLEKEDIPSDKGQPLILNMPVIRNKEYKKSGLYSLRVKGDADFKKAAAKLFLRFDSRIKPIVLDCYAKVQIEASQNRSTGEITKNRAVLRPEHLAFLNYDAIYSELQRYKTEKARHNVNITRRDVKALLQNNQWYQLLIPEDELAVRSFEDYKRFDKLAIALLTKYLDRFYYAEQNRWESQVVGYNLVFMDDNNENFLNEEKDEYSISIEDTAENETAILWIRKVIEEAVKAKNEKRMPNFINPRQGDMAVFCLPAHLYHPLLSLADGNMKIGISPVALNEAELKFVKALQVHITTYASDFADKEIYLIRNRSKKGIGFFDDAGFYPDFILWLLAGGKQYITFIDPHGMAREAFTSNKVGLYKRLKTEIEAALAKPSVSLTSFILSPTKYSGLYDKGATIAEWTENHVLFMEDSNYIKDLFSGILG